MTDIDKTLDEIEAEIKRMGHDFVLYKEGRYYCINIMLHSALGPKHEFASTGSFLAAARAAYRWLKERKDTPSDE